MSPLVGNGQVSQCCDKAEWDHLSCKAGQVLQMDSCLPGDACSCLQMSQMSAVGTREPQGWAARASSGPWTALAVGQTSGLMSLVAFKVKTQEHLLPVEALEWHQFMGDAAPSPLGSSRGLWMILLQLDKPAMGGPGTLVTM